VGVHPYRDYQAGEIHQIVDAYHCGLVFDSTDIQRIVNTNLKIMWNQDRAKPHFNNSNATHAVLKKIPQGGHWEGLAGTLWTALDDFDQTIRDLHAGWTRKSDPHDIGRLYFERIMLKEKPGFARKYPLGQVRPLPFDFTECRDINMAVALPGTFAAGKTTILASKAWKPGELEIALYGPDGKGKKAVLYRGQAPGEGDGIKGFHIQVWDGKDPATGRQYTGSFRVRWTMGQDYRERPIVIK
jgi:hypothetical protein